MKKLLTAILICAMTSSLFGCEEEPQLEIPEITTTAEVTITAEEKPEPEYITTNEYYSDLLSEEDIKLLKENIVTMDVLIEALGMIVDESHEEIIPETHEYVDIGWNNNWTKYYCEEYGGIYVTATSFYSKEIDDYVEYVYKCEYVDGIGGSGDQTYDIRVPLFYKRIAPPSNINFEGREKFKKTKEYYREIEKRYSYSFDAEEFEEEYAFWRKEQDKFLTEEEQQFLRDNVVTIDTLEQVVGSMTFIGDFASGRRDELYINERFRRITIGGSYTVKIELDNENEINYYEDMYIFDVDEQHNVKIFLPM